MGQGTAVPPKGYPAAPCLRGANQQRALNLCGPVADRVTGSFISLCLWPIGRPDEFPSLPPASPQRHPQERLAVAPRRAPDQGGDRPVGHPQPAHAAHGALHAAEVQPAHRAVGHGRRCGGWGLGRGGMHGNLDLPAGRATSSPRCSGGSSAAHTASRTASRTAADNNCMLLLKHVRTIPYPLRRVSAR